MSLCDAYVLANQILGAVLNMSHFAPPGSSTPHYIFGPPDQFNKTCSNLGIEVLTRVEMDPEMSRRGDLGWPAVMTGETSIEGSQSNDNGASRVRSSFQELAQRVWGKIE
jgi:ATP-binding protein involved in chromosome partitioning